MRVGSSRYATARMMAKSRISMQYAMKKIFESKIFDYIDAVYLYGSCARYEQRYDSDVDIAIELSENINIDSYKDEIFMLLSKISPVNSDIPDVDTKILIGSNWRCSPMLYYKNLSRDAIVLYKKGDPVS